MFLFRTSCYTKNTNSNTVNSENRDVPSPQQETIINLYNDSRKLGEQLDSIKEESKKVQESNQIRKNNILDILKKV